MAAAAILDRRIRKIWLADSVWRAQMHHCTKFCQNQSFHCGDIAFFSNFQDGGRPPSWICLGHIWTTCSEYFWVTITLQNLVMIDAVVFIMWTFQYLTRLAGKCLFTPPKWGFLGNLIPKMGCNINESQNGTPLRESASFEPLSVKMWWTVWPAGELLKKGV